MTMRNELRKFKERLKTKRGESTLLWVVLALIVVSAFQGHVNILNQTSTVNEFQQKMDVSGLNALNNTIDIDRLQREEDLVGQITREEFLEQYGADIEKEFRKELYKNFPKNQQITNVEILNVNVDFMTTSEGALGTQHILLDGIIRITMKPLGVNTATNEDELLREFQVGNGGSTRVTHVRRDTEGQLQMLLHNQTRLKY